MSAKKSSVKINNLRRTTPRLKDKRREHRRRLVLVWAAALIAFVAFALWGLHQNAVRISSVELKGADNLLPGADPVAVAKGALQGSYFGLIPKSSTFFFPEHAMREAVIAAHPEIAAITFSHAGLTGIVMRAATHTAVGKWCGLAPTPGVTPYCYYYDPDGFIYAAAPEPLGASEASSTDTAVFSPATGGDTKTVNSFDLYAPLVNNVQEPLRATIVHANNLPDAAALARQIEKTFAVIVTALVFRNDEADVLLTSGTRITYVLGHEQEAYSALTSAKSDLDLAGGSLEYIDLRFSGKVYFKKK